MQRTECMSFSFRGHDFAHGSSLNHAFSLTHIYHVGCEHSQVLLYRIPPPTHAAVPYSIEPELPYMRDSNSSAATATAKTAATKTTGSAAKRVSVCYGGKGMPGGTYTTWAQQHGRSPPASASASASRQFVVAWGCDMSQSQKRDDNDWSGRSGVARY